MSRSYKKHNYYNFICMSTKEQRRIKRLTNRLFRRRMNRGDFDEYVNQKSVNKKVIDQSWSYDLFRVRASRDDMLNTDWAPKLIRK